jgi:hypothetical protein
MESDNLVKKLYEIAYRKLSIFRLSSWIRMEHSSDQDDGHGKLIGWKSGDL